jgi:hypothetical protein
MTMTALLDDALLSVYVGSFLGHGNLQAPYWFVGMEEGGDNDIVRIAKNLARWDAKGRPEVDSFPTHPDSPWFRQGASIQKTWQYLIRATLALSGKPKEAEHIRDYQIHSLGRKDGETALLELMPLPSKSLADWVYKDYSRLPFLQSREAYWEHCVETRCRLLRARALEFRPKAVVFYSTSPNYLAFWHKIAGTDDFALERHGRLKLYSRRTQETSYIICSGPTTPGVSYDYYDRVGSLMRPPASHS